MKKLWLWLIIVAVAAGVVAGIFVLRGQTDEGADSAEAIAERLWNFSQFRPEGFTVDVRTMEQPDEGIAVAYAATQGCHSRESLVFVVTHALQHDGYVGGWLDRDSGLYYFDSTRLFPENQLEEAFSLPARTANWQFMSSPRARRFAWKKFPWRHSNKVSYMCLKIFLFG